MFSCFEEAKLPRKTISYNPKLKLLARKLHNDSTLAEVLLWNQLKGRKIFDYQFLRQKPLDNYIVDFFSYDLMLVIEIDGDSHCEKIQEDHVRQKRLESFGVHFLRFSDHDIKNKMDGVLKRIESWIEDFEKSKS